MRMRALCCTASAVLIVVGVACTGAERSLPTAPTSTLRADSPAPSPLPPIPFSPFPPVTRPARVYGFAESLSPAREWTLGSRFVLYDDHTFALQYTHSRGSFEYPGRYTESDGSVTFHWEGWSLAGPWGATATVAGDLLTVRYNLIMQLSDFQDAVYRHTSTSAEGAR